MSLITVPKGPTRQRMESKKATEAQVFVLYGTKHMADNPLAHAY